VIQLVDRAVERFLRQAVPLTEATVDVSFDAPDRTWGASLTRPTVSVFLWRVSRNPSFQYAGMEQRLAPQGTVERRPATPVVDLHYLVTAWASEYVDEHQLLGQVLSAVLSHSQLPASALGDDLAGVKVGLSLAPAEHSVPGEFWSALDGRLKPGLQVEVHLPMDVFDWKAAGPPTDAVEARVSRLPAATPPASPSTNRPPLRRRRTTGALVMEGRADQAGDQGPA
jgi:Pvc16 N-terminal domain